MKLNKHNFLKLAACAALIAAAPFLAGDLHAQAPEGPDTSSSTTEDSTGNVTAIAPHQSISVNSRRGPFTYRLGRDLHVVGLDGKPGDLHDVHVGQRVTVFYYMRDGEETVARITVLQPAKKGK